MVKVEKKIKLSLIDIFPSSVLEIENRAFYRSMEAAVQRESLDKVRGRTRRQLRNSRNLQRSRPWNSTARR